MLFIHYSAIIRIIQWALSVLLFYLTAYFFYELVFYRPLTQNIVRSNTGLTAVKELTENPEKLKKLSENAASLAITDANERIKKEILDLYER